MSPRVLLRCVELPYLLCHMFSDRSGARPRASRLSSRVPRPVPVSCDVMDSTPRTLWRPQDLDVVGTSATNGNSIVNNQNNVIEQRLLEFRQAREYSRNNTVGDAPQYLPSMIELACQSLVIGQTVSFVAILIALFRKLIVHETATSAFVSLVTALFAYLRAKPLRQYIGRSYPKVLHLTLPRLMVTIALTVLAWMLLSSFEKKFIFSIMQVIVLFISPLIRSSLQKHKRIITGPWDIAHITPKT